MGHLTHFNLQFFEDIILLLDYKLVHICYVHIYIHTNFVGCRLEGYGLMTWEEVQGEDVPK